MTPQEITELQKVLDTYVAEADIIDIHEAGYNLYDGVTEFLKDAASKVTP